MENLSDQELLNYLVSIKVQVVLWDRIYEALNVQNPPNIPNLRAIRTLLIANQHYHLNTH